MRYPDESTVLDDLAAIITTAVPTLAGKYVRGPVSEPPLDLALILEYGNLVSQPDGIDYATHEFIARVAFPWQTGVAFAEHRDLLSGLCRDILAALPAGTMLASNFIVLTGPFSIQSPRVGIERPAAVDNILWASVTVYGESKEGYQ
jgi:hypothetical protein